jgi:hypothetical protein
VNAALLWASQREIFYVVPLYRVRTASNDAKKLPATARGWGARRGGFGSVSAGLTRSPLIPFRQPLIFSAAAAVDPGFPGMAPAGIAKNT